MGEDSRVKTGAEILAAENFARLAGRKLGLIVNHTARVGEAHLIDLLHQEPNLDLVALFGPEHGLRGTADAGASITSGRDTETGLPIHSLYGDTHQPTDAMLRGIDMLVFDIQDIGVRFYTYISTMGLAMQAAARAGIPFMVLDRPNPLGGDYVSGFVMRPEHISFVGQYPIPIAHGLTVGELARMIKGEAWLSGLGELDLRIVAMSGWRRAMRWPDTGAGWRRPSPNIPDFETAQVYAGTGLFEATSASEGRGSSEPFRLLGTPWADGPALASVLQAQAWPGVRFEAARFTPRPIEGMEANPKHDGVPLRGIRMTVTDMRAFRPVETGMAILHAFASQARAKGETGFIAKPDWLAKTSGTGMLETLLERALAAENIIAAWRAEVSIFRKLCQPYVLYQ